MGSELVCPYENCGKEFKQLVMLTNETENQHETYYACPHCHSRVDLILQDMKDFTTVRAVVSVDAKAYKRKEERPENCPHYVGYLKALPENMPLPDDCLICPKAMICFANIEKC